MEIYWKIPTDGPKIGSYDFEVSISTDNKTYTTATRKNSQDFLSTVGIMTDARYVKLTAYSNTVAESFGIRDCTFYEYKNNSRTLSDGRSTAVCIGSGTAALTSAAKIVIEGGGALNAAILEKGGLTKLSSLTALENAKLTLADGAAVAARDKDDLVICTKTAGTLLLSDGTINLSAMAYAGTSQTPAPEGSAGGAAGGGGGKGNNYADLKKDDATSSGEASTPQFSDIEGHWAKNEILAAQKAGLVNGIDETHFEPDRPVTRAELAALALRLSEGGESTFEPVYNDVTADDWFAQIVCAVNELKLMQGYPDGCFYPNKSITRQEAAKVCAAFVESETQRDGAAYFTDWEEVAPWAREAVEKTAASGIFMGDDNGFFNPEKSLTRAEAATIFYRIYLTRVANEGS